MLQIETKGRPDSRRTGSTNSSRDPYKQQMGDARVSLLRFAPIHPFDGLGADGHPSLDTHAKMADELTAFLQTLN